MMYVNLYDISFLALIAKQKEGIESNDQTMILISVILRLKD